MTNKFHNTLNKLKMGKGFSTNDNPTHRGQTNTWYTPRHITDALGTFSVDPCTNSNAPFFHALSNAKHDLGDDGLSWDWVDRVWLNPPYGSEIVKWLDKLYDHGNGIALVFARTETVWAQKHMSICDGFNLLKGRISFISSNGIKSSNASNGSMLLAYGKNNLECLYSLRGNVFINGDSHNGCK